MRLNRAASLLFAMAYDQKGVAQDEPVSQVTAFGAALLARDINPGQIQWTTPNEGTASHEAHVGIAGFLRELADAVDPRPQATEIVAAITGKPEDCKSLLQSLQDMRGEIIRDGTRGNETTRLDEAVTLLKGLYDNYGPNDHNFAIAEHVRMFLVAEGVLADG